MYAAYSVLIVAFFALVSPYLLYQAVRYRKYIRSLPQRLGYLPLSFNLDGDECIWIHAVSVGEVLTTRALLPELRQRYPRLRIFVSTTTMTGQQVARTSLPYVDEVFYLPFDLAFIVRRTLRLVKPRLFVVMETELWPNLLRVCQEAGVHTVLVNGRISSRSYPRYRLAKPFFRRVLRYFRISADRPVVIAASTLRGEEEAVLEAFSRVRATIPSTLLIIAPRKPERFDEVERLARRGGWNVARRSELRVDDEPRQDVVILDTIGELAQLFQVATAVFVGGSLVDAGGHNILEPAVFGKPIVFGPYMQNFAEIAHTFLDSRAAIQIRQPRELEPVLLDLLRDPVQRARLGAAARALVEANRGARLKTLAAIAQLLPPDQPGGVVRQFRLVH